MQSEPGVPVLRLIARLNVGGPAIQVVNLTKRLEAHGYRTVLLRGQEGPQEGSMDHLAEQLGVRPVRVAGLQRELGLHDLRALLDVMRWIRRVRPRVLHTHTAKAGAIGRIAVLLSPRHRPDVIVHTFHGHVFKGEFSPRKSRVFARIERLLARGTTRVVAVSPEVRQDLIDLGVADPDRVEVVRLGFDLSPFAERDDEREQIRAATRERLGIPADARVVTVIARVVKVKRIDRFIDMASRLSDIDDAYFLVAGDGDRRAELETSPAAVALEERLVWAGFERDIAAICFASDVVALTSDNEGTPVCLIEAQAAGLPVVTTDVGGVATVVDHGRSGTIVGEDAGELADAVRTYLEDPQLARESGRRGREHVLARFGIDRLVRDIADLYGRLLDEAGRRDGRVAARR
jgi:glycosyltransferase involved in cell wall biosynthesis